MQCYTLSSFMLLTTLFQIYNFHSWSCCPCCVPASGDLTSTSTGFLGSSSLYISTVQLGPSDPLCKRSALTPPSSTKIFPPPSAPSHPHVSNRLLCLLLSLPPLTCSGFFNGMLDSFEPVALNYIRLYLALSCGTYLYPEI